MQKKLCNFYFFTKKNDFRAIFRLFTASVRSRPPGPPAVPGVLNNSKAYIPAEGSKLAQAACVRHACLRAPCVAWPLLSPSFALLLLSFGPGGLRAPCVLACAMHSLAIVITNFRSFSLLTHFGETPMCEIISPQIFWHN